MKQQLLIFILLCTLFPVTAQKIENKNYSQQLGLQAGFCTGLGLSYRYWPGKLGIQISSIPLKTEKSWADLMNIQQIYEDQNINIHNTTFISLGLTGLIKLKQFDHFNLFSYWGNHFLFQLETTYNTGIGLGFAVEAPVSFNFMVGYGGYNLLNSLNLYPTIELGLYYRFRKL